MWLKKIQRNIGPILNSFVFAICVMGIVIAMSICQRSVAQPSKEDLSRDLADNWQGTIHVWNDLRIVVAISKVDKGYNAVFYTIDVGPTGFPVASTMMKLVAEKSRRVKGRGLNCGPCRLGPDRARRWPIFAKASHFISSSSFRASPNNA